MGAKRYNSTYSLVLGGCDRSASCPGHLKPRKRALLYPLNKRLSGPQNWFGCFGKEKQFCPHHKSNHYSSPI